MNILILFLSSLLATHPPDSTLSGQITYTERPAPLSAKMQQDLEKTFPDPQERAAILATLTGGPARTATLSFDGEASRYEVQAAPTTDEGGSQRMLMLDDEVVFRRLADDQLVRQVMVMGKRLLVTGAEAPLEWELTGQTRTIGPFAVRQAVAMRKRQRIEAWFAPDLPIATGPGTYGGLPGLILELTVTDGQQYVFQSFTDQLTSPPTPPTKGKKMTAAQLPQLLEAQTEEMNKNAKGERIRVEVIGQ